MASDLALRQLDIVAILETDIMDRAAFGAEEVAMGADIGIVIQVTVDDVERLHLLDPLEHVQCVVDGRK